jgi:hypothetical protein
MFLNFEPSASERARRYRELAKMADEKARAPGAPNVHQLSHFLSYASVGMPSGPSNKNPRIGRPV